MALWMNILWCHRTTYLVLMYNVILDILIIALGDILVVALVSCGILVVALVHPHRGTLGHYRSGLCGFQWSISSSCRWCILVVALMYPRCGVILGHHRSGLLRLSAVHILYHCPTQPQCSVCRYTCHRY